MKALKRMLLGIVLILLGIWGAIASTISSSWVNILSLLPIPGILVFLWGFFTHATKTRRQAQPDGGSFR